MSSPIRIRRAALVGAALAALLAGCTANGSGPVSNPGSASETSAAAASSGTESTSPPISASPSPEAIGEEQFTPLVSDVMSVPQWFTGSDDKVHLTYELRMVNAFPVPVSLTQVAVLDADTGQTLDTLAGASLAAAMSLLVPQTDQTTQLANATVGVLWMDVVLDTTAQLPKRITHDLTVTVPPGLPVPETITSRGGGADVSPDTPSVLGPPLTGTGWVAVGSCCDGPHRRTAQPIDNRIWVSQRFAIDFNKIDDKGLLASGDRSLNPSWFTYDQPVLAVADAKVVQAADAYPDQIPDNATPVSIAEADGNFVILRVSDGHYAFYAHLKPGSVAVKAGDTVTRGQVIGRTGNSGSSTGPHLHFQLMDRPSALAADGRPYVFDSFTVAGRGPTLTDLIALDPTQDPVTVDPVNAGPRTDQLPLSRDVVDFAG